MVWATGGRLTDRDLGHAPLQPAGSGSPGETGKSLRHFPGASGLVRLFWGTPIATQMAFVYYESSFRSHARPPRTRLWGLIPWARPTTAFGYAQALDPAWQEYLAANDGDWLTVRSDMQYALDFVGWYNRLSHQQLGIPYTAPRELYLAYHEGRTGYARRSFDRKPQLQALASRVRARAYRYHNQLQQCEAEFQCWRWYQFWPFCSAED